MKINNLNIYDAGEAAADITTMLVDMRLLLSIVELDEVMGLLDPNSFHPTIRMIRKEYNDLLIKYSRI